MDVYVMLFKEILVNLVLLADGTDITDPGPCGFLHHVSHLPSKQYFSLSRHDIHLNLKGISAHAGPCQSPDNPDFIRFIRHLVNI